MTTWAQINQKLDFFLGDEQKADASGGLRPRLFPESLRIEAWNWAQRVFCAHTPRKVETILAIEHGKREGLLPSDFYAVEAIYDALAEKWWRPMRRNPGDVRYEDDDLEEFWTWGEKLYFETSVEYDTDRLTLLYWAYWPDIEFELGENKGSDTKPVYEVILKQDQVHTPRWAEGALMHMTAAFCLQPLAVAAADVNEWKINVDAGNPIQNPRAVQSKEHLSWYHAILDKFPPARGKVE